ncbi:MAG TPA: hypothetical protein VF412_07380 [Bdellovibrio sp.]|uniref:hypothetical protein n=1 Tax=Bdellovibrio sp. TaxID=28201 RepID=UPI002EEB9CB0
MNFFAENLKVFKKAALPLFVLVVVSNNIDQYLNMEVETALQNPLGASSQVYFFGFLSIVSSVIFPVLLMSTALFALAKTESGKSLTIFLGHYINQIFIETLRAWGKTLMWSLLFIVPGIWKYLELILVPFVVTSSDRYNAGEVDALKASSYVFRQHWFKILGIIIFFHLFIPLVLTSFFDSYRLIWKTPIASLVLSLIDTYIILVSTQLLFNVFQSEVRKHDSHV